MQIVLLMFGWLSKMTSLTKVGIKGVGKNHLLILYFFSEKMNSICGVCIVVEGEAERVLLLMILNSSIFQLIKNTVISSCQLTFLF